MIEIAVKSWQVQEQRVNGRLEEARAVAMLWMSL